MRDFQNEKGLWQSVEDEQIGFAKEQVDGPLQLMTINDYYKDKRINKITFESKPPIEVVDNIGTAQAVLFHLS